MLADVIDYGQVKLGSRNESIIASFQTLIATITMFCGAKNPQSTTPARPIAGLKLAIANTCFFVKQLERIGKRKKAAISANCAAVVKIGYKPSFPVTYLK